ncbi:MAG: hypothetical protein R2769_11345 [Saprospiraceae bacterium]
MPTILLWRYFLSMFGNDRYRFTMKIYRDCSDPRGDQFDSRAPVTVYLGNGEPYTQFLHEYVSIRPNIRTFLLIMEIHVFRFRRVFVCRKEFTF